MQKITSKIYAIGLLLSILVLSGCGAMTTAVKKRSLEVKTQMSETIWLDPASEQTVYLQIKNTSDKDMSDLQRLIEKSLQEKGYTVVKDPNTAFYWIQANVLKADKMDLRDAQGYLKQGYEGGLTGAVLGASIAGSRTGSWGSALGVGAATGVAGWLADTMVEDINYSMVTDLQISAKAGKGNKVIVNDTAALNQGTSGKRVQRHQEKTNRLKYQTRIVSNANKVNLKFEEAKPVLEAQLAKSIASIL